jgi:thioredoxin-related protein
MKYLLTSVVLIAAGGTTVATTQAQNRQHTARQVVHEHTAPEGVFDHKDVEEAWKVAIEKKKPLLVMFTSNNCTFCRKMIADTYSNQGVKDLLRGRTESVMAHSDHYAALIKKLGIRGYPSSLLISPEGEVLDFMEGYVDPQEFTKRVGPLLDRPVTQIGMNTSSPTVGQQ